MDQLIRILYVDDNPDDRTLVRRALAKGPGRFDLREAASYAEFETLLGAETFALVLTDYHLPGFTALQVLERVQETRPGLPVVVISGTGSEATAVEAMKHGMADYVLKSQHGIRHLPQTLLSVLETRRLEEENKRAEEALRESEERFSKTFRNLPSGLAISRLSDDKIIEANEAFIDMLGFAREEVIGHTSLELNLIAHPEDRQRVVQLLREKGALRDLEFELRRKSGEIRQARLSAEMIKIGGEPCTITIVQDITERKRAEVEKERAEKTLRSVLEINRILTEQKARPEPPTTPRRAPGRLIRILNLEEDPNDVAINRRTLEKAGLKVEITHAESAKAFQAALEKGTFDEILSDYHLPGYDGMQALRYVREHHPRLPLIFVTGTLYDEDEMIETLKQGANDYVNKQRIAKLPLAVQRTLEEAAIIAERERAEEALRTAEALYHDLVETAQDLIWQCDAEGRYTYLNPAWEQVLGYKVEEMLGKKFTDFQTPE